MPRRLQLAGALGHAATDKRLEILRGVGQSGSISQAARQAGVSYKAAWQALDTLSNLAGVPLVERAVGGAGGGGASLTPAGTRLLLVAGEMALSREQTMARLNLRGQAPVLAALALRTSMRNQLPCVVAGVVVHGALARVELRLPQEGAIVARITTESAQLLDLVSGLEVLALCKATAVKVERAGTARARPGFNQLSGRATRVARGDAGDEVAAQVGGLGLVGFAPARSGLRAGSPVTLRMDEAAVVIALAR